MTKKKTFSILGDSISTFTGITPRMFDFYDSYTQQAAGMKGVEDTWWMKVIRHFGGELGYNNSMAGSTVTGNISTSATSKKRLESLAIKGTPDIILLYMGSNDWAFSVLPEEFEEEYRSMLYSLISLYPDTEIYCATLIRGMDAKDPENRFFNVDGCISPKIYSRIIRKCVDEAGLNVVDLEQYHQEYTTIDGIHPDAEGMETIAQLWIKELKENLLP